MKLHRDPSHPAPALVLCKLQPATRPQNPTKGLPYLRRTTWTSPDQIFAEAGHLPDYESSIVARAEAARARRETSLFERLRRAYLAFMHVPHANHQAFRRNSHA